MRTARRVDDRLLVVINCRSCSKNRSAFKPRRRSLTIHICIALSLLQLIKMLLLTVLLELICTGA